MTVKRKILLLTGIKTQTATSLPEPSWIIGMFSVTCTKEQGWWNRGTFPLQCVKEICLTFLLLAPYSMIEVTSWGIGSYLNCSINSLSNKSNAACTVSMKSHCQTLQTQSSYNFLKITNKPYHWKDWSIIHSTYNILFVLYFLLVLATFVNYQFMFRMTFTKETTYILHVTQSNTNFTKVK